MLFILFFHNVQTNISVEIMSLFCLLLMLHSLLCIRLALSRAARDRNDLTSSDSVTEYFCQEKIVFRVLFL